MKLRVKTLYPYIFLASLLLSTISCARMSGPAIGEAIQMLTKKYIPEAQQQDFTQTEYDQWFEKTNTLYNRLKASKPDAVTRGTPSIQQLFEQVAKKQLSQLKTKAVTIPEKEALEVIIKEDIQQAPSEIQDDLREAEESLEKEIEEEYISEALEKDLTVDEYQTWLEEITSLYEQLEKSDPQALTQGTPSIEENLEKAVSKQLTQFEDLAKDEKTPLEEIQHIEKILEQQTTTAPAIIQDELKTSEEKIEDIIENVATKQQEETEEITHMVKAIAGAEKLEVEDDKKQAVKLQELDELAEKLEKENQERIQQETQQAKEKFKQEQQNIDKLMQDLLETQKTTQSLTEQYNKAKQTKNEAQEKEIAEKLKLEQQKEQELQTQKKQEDKELAIAKTENDHLETFNKKHDTAIQQVEIGHKEREAASKLESENQEQIFKKLKESFDTALNNKKIKNTVKIDAGKKLIDYIAQIVTEAQIKIENLTLTDIFGLLFNDNLSLNYKNLELNFTKFSNNILSQIKDIKTRNIRSNLLEYYKQINNEAVKNLALLQYTYTKKIIEQFNEIFKKNIINNFTTYAGINEQTIIDTTPIIFEVPLIKFQSYVTATTHITQPLKYAKFPNAPQKTIANEITQEKNSIQNIILDLITTFNTFIKNLKPDSSAIHTQLDIYYKKLIEIFKLLNINRKAITEFVETLNKNKEKKE